MSVTTYVGVRELRNSLSQHLKQVQAGEEVVVTDHGVPVARIRPYKTRDLLEELVQQGEARQAQQRKRARKPLPVGDTALASDLIKDQRR